MRSSSAFEDLDDDDDDTKIVRFKILRSKRPKTVFASSSSSSFKDDFFALQLSENENETKIALGETARWLISAQNANDDNNNRRVATKTRIKAEVLVGNKTRFSQKRRGVSSASIQGATSFILLDEIGDGKTTEATSCSLKPSESREAEVHFSAKHLGEHTLKCTAEYVDCPYDERSAVAIMNVAGENTVYDVGERKRAVSYFSFDVTNPLHVRTKTRRVFTRSRSEDSDNNSRVVVKRRCF